MTDLRYQDLLPLSWDELAGPPGEPELARLAGANERLLRLLPGAEPTAEARDDDTPVPHHLQQLDLRMQLLMEMLGELLAQARPLPPRRRVWLGARELSWLDAEGPAEGALVLVELYLHDSLPKGLRLAARVVGREPAEEGGVRLTVGYLAPGEGVVEQLEKFIFRQHRRALASRSQPRSG